jgi:hypothetical protein
MSILLQDIHHFYSAYQTLPHLLPDRVESDRKILKLPPEESQPFLKIPQLLYNTSFVLVIKNKLPDCFNQEVCFFILYAYSNFLF